MENVHPQFTNVTVVYLGSANLIMCCAENISVSILSLNCARYLHLILCQYNSKDHILCCCRGSLKGPFWKILPLLVAYSLERIQHVCLDWFVHTHTHTHIVMVYWSGWEHQIKCRRILSFFPPLFYFFIFVFGNFKIIDEKFLFLFRWILYL